MHNKCEILDCKEEGKYKVTISDPEEKEILICQSHLEFLGLSGLYRITSFGFKTI